MTIDVGEVAMISINDIEVGERYREEMGDVNELEASMKESGLIGPLAVSKTGDKYKLLAGERRLIVLRKNDVDKIPVRIYSSDISELERRVIEKAENFYRKDMEYWEYDKLVSDIHSMQQELHGVKAPGPSQEGWGVKDTGEMMGMSKGPVSEAIKRSEARQAYPDLFEHCKTQKDATNLIKKMDEAVIKEAISKKLDSGGASSDIQQLAKSYILGDVFEGMKKIPSGVIHMVEIDPPYAIGLKEAKKRDSEVKYDMLNYNEVTSSSYLDGDPDPKTPWRGMNSLFKECYRVMSDHSWLLCWIAPEPWFCDIYSSIRSAGFETTRMCGIWTKRTGQSRRPEIHLANSYEMFFYAWKGRPAMNKAGSTNMFDYAPVSAEKKTHPTERPLDMMIDIYDTFAFPGSRILIPFLGSGSGLLAAHTLGMSAFGYDLGKSFRDSFLVKLHNMRR